MQGRSHGKQLAQGMVQSAMQMATQKQSSQQQPVLLAPKSAEAALVRLCGLSPETAVALVHGSAQDADGQELEFQWGTPLSSGSSNGKAAPPSGRELMEEHCGSRSAVLAGGVSAVEERLR